MGSGAIVHYACDVSALAPVGEQRLLSPQNPQLASYTLRGGVRITDPIIAEDVTLVPGSFSFCTDGDADALCSSADNCPLRPNSPSLGTCVRLVSGLLVGTGTACLDNAACGSGQTCQLEQGDMNGNGIGDACECYADISGSAGARDGKVDSFDLLRMKQQFNRTGCTPATCQADLNVDGRVDSFDMLIMKVQFNETGCPVP